MIIYNSIKVCLDLKKKKKMLAPSKESYDKPRQSIKKQRCHFANKGLCRLQFFHSHVRM